MLCVSCEVGELNRSSLSLEKTITDITGSSIIDVVRTSAEYLECDHCRCRFSIDLDTDEVDLDSELDVNEIADELGL